jgi:hypothetical protein
VLDFDFIWDEEPGGNVEHIALHDLTPEDVIHAFHYVERTTVSRSSARPAIIGYTPEGDRIFVPYRQLDATTVYVETAYRI